MQQQPEPEYAKAKIFPLAQFVPPDKHTGQDYKVLSKKFRWNERRVSIDRVLSMMRGPATKAGGHGYANRVYTTSVVTFPEMKHIEADENGHKDFSALIDHAIRLGGYAEDGQMQGVNGGTAVTTGFGRQTVLDNAPAIIDAVKAGAIKHFFLVGGCDGAKPGRNYYTDFVKQTPKDSLMA